MDNIEEFNKTNLINIENIKNIDEIRRNVVIEIKEKVKRNPKYLHPCNKERLEDMKRLMFISGNEFTNWMQQNGVMMNPTEVELEMRKKKIKNAECRTEKEYRDKLAQEDGCKNRKEHDNKKAQEFGFKDTSERAKIRRWETGYNEPAEFNEDCSTWFAEFTENLMINRYPGAIKTPPNNPGFDYLWGDIKINNKGRCLYYGKDRSPNCAFPIGYNNTADIFIISGWDNRENLNPLFALEFHKNDLVRKGKGGFAPKVEFWKRDTFSVTYTPYLLEQFRDHMIDIDWMKDICDKMK